MSIFLMTMVVFLVFVFLEILVSFNIELLTVAAVLAKGMPLVLVSQMAFTGLDSHTYLVIPMFILAGYLMETGGLSKRLVNFAASLAGNIHGGLGIITVLACALFMAILGSSSGTVAAVGVITVPPMVEKGYDRDSSVASIASAGSLGVLISPSIPMVLYCIAGEVFIEEVFMVGSIPGFLVTAALAFTIYTIPKKNGYKSDEGEFEWGKVAASFKEAARSLLAPVIILDGIYSGIFTPTEAAVVIMVYSMFVGLFVTKELKMSDLPGIPHKSTVTAGTTVFIPAFVMVFLRYLTLNQIPQLIGSVILGTTGNVRVALILFVLLCFVTGTFLETASQVLIHTPLFLPILKGLDVNPLHFGIPLIVGTMLGMMTPLVGINLLVVQGIGGAKISKMTKAVLPFLFMMLFMQILFVFFPGFSTLLPGLFSK